MSQTKPVTLSISTPDGVFVAHYSDKGLCGLNFPSRQGKPKQNSTQVSQQIHTWHKLTVSALKQVLAGKIPENLPPLDLSSGTDFQQSVWRAMLQIRCGQTLSYGQVAQAIGNPKAVRAVGGACGANPIPVLVPCHRVLAAHQRLGGFSSDPNWKRTLLTRERVQWTS
jgi:methylated-DNA-[protein]-cysteine S-methyltransferase